MFKTVVRRAGYTAFRQRLPRIGRRFSAQQSGSVEGKEFLVREGGCEACTYYKTELTKQTLRGEIKESARDTRSQVYWLFSSGSGFFLILFGYLKDQSEKREKRIDMKLSELKGTILTSNSATLREGPDPVSAVATSK